MIHDPRAAANGLRGDQVVIQYQLRSFGIRLHVKSLDFGWIVMDKHRPVKIFRNRGFLVSAQIVPPLDGKPFLFQNVQGFVIRDPGKGELHLRQGSGVSLQDFQLFTALFEGVLHHIGD